MNYFLLGKLYFGFNFFIKLVKPIFSTTEIVKRNHLSNRNMHSLNLKLSTDHFKAMDSCIVCCDSWHLTTEVDATDACDDEDWDRDGNRSVEALFITAVNWGINSLCLYLIRLVIWMLLTDLPTPRNHCSALIIFQFTFSLIKNCAKTWLSLQHYD